MVTSFNCQKQQTDTKKLRTKCDSLTRPENWKEILIQKSHPSSTNSLWIRLTAENHIIHYYSPILFELCKPIIIYGAGQLRNKTNEWTIGATVAQTLMAYNYGAFPWGSYFTWFSFSHWWFFFLMHWLAKFILQVCLNANSLLDSGTTANKFQLVFPFPW